MCKTKIKMIMRKLLNGCSIMHEQKIMHRDIKPANLIFENSTDYSSLKICDFGYATSSNLSNCLFHSCGTPGFVAPEII